MATVAILYPSSRTIASVQRFGKAQTVQKVQAVQIVEKPDLGSEIF
jgi:hypothetical protein